MQNLLCMSIKDEQNEDFVIFVASLVLLISLEGVVDSY